MSDLFSSEDTFSKFEQEGTLHTDVVRQLTFLNYTIPTRIQSLSLSALVAGKDCLVQSLTGSGKTLAFAVPLMQKLRTLDPPAKRSDGCYAVILSPTKELCLQTFGVITKLIRMMPNLVVGHVAGGDNPKKEKARLRKGLTILCATPGRLVYHLESTASLVTDKLQMLILDEADRLLDMGFEKQIREAHSRLVKSRVEAGNSRCQVVLVSATLTQRVRSLADWCLDTSNSAWISSAVDEEGNTKTESSPVAPGFAIPTRLVQRVAIVDLKYKLVCLVGSILQAQADGNRRVMIFFNSCSSVEFYHALFSILRWPSFEKYSQPSHGNLPRRELKRIKNTEEDEDAIIKTPSRVTTDQYTGEKVFRGVSMNILHGDLNSQDRAGAMADFARPLTENTKMRVLLCTDVVARGVDFAELDLVIQADPPQQTDEYLHRIGRTARIGNDGNALLFIAPNESAYIDHLRSKCMDDVHFAKTSQKQLIAECQKFNPDQVSQLRDFPQFLNSHFAQQVAANEDVDIMARKAFLSALRAYRTFQGADLREIFNVKDLHGGHLAACFGLTDCPKTIALSMQDRKKADFARRDARQSHHKKRRFEHTLTLREPKEFDPPAKLWQGKIDRPRKLDPKPLNPMGINSLVAMEFQS